MMNHISCVIQNAFDALAPPAPLHEDFVYHWKKLMKHYLDVSTTSKVAIEMTNIPARLEQLEKILLREDADSTESSMGLCLEYFLKHNLLDLLVTLAITDDPPGMRQYVLVFVTQIINHLKTCVLDNKAVYPSFQRLIEMCNGTCPTPSELDEVTFLFALSAQLRKQPHLVYVYMSQEEDVEHKAIVSSCSSQVNAEAPNNTLFRPMAPPAQTLEPKLVPVTQTVPAQSVEGTSAESTAQFPLIDSLINFIDSADGRVRVKACQGIMLIASLPDDKFAQLMIKHSSLSECLALKLTALYLEIPPGTDPNNIDDMHISWGLDSPIPIEVEESYEGCRQTALFLGWLDFCDQIAVEGRPCVASSLSLALCQHFLEQEFTQELLPNSLVIALLAKCFKMVTSSCLLQGMSEWLVGEGRGPELPGVVTCRTRQALLDTCSHSDPAVSLESLRLFEVVLEKNIDHAIHCLVLTYLEGRGYYNNALSPNHLESWSDEEDEREKHRASPDADLSSVTSRTIASSHINKIIHSLVSVVPPSLRSSPVESGGYQQYISESQRQYSLVVAACSRFAWPAEAISDDNLSSDSRPEADSRQFYEGPFLRMIFNRIRNLPNQAYEVNLELTAVISRLALLPHPYLHEYLLTIGMYRRPEADCLMAALSDTAAQLQSLVTALPDYKALLQHTRHRLLGHTTDNKDKNCNLLESVVVLEEMCKELAAIAYVKYHQAT